MIVAAGVLLTNVLLRPLETLYQVRLSCRTPAAAHIRSLLLSTIGRLPMTLQSIHSEQDDATDQTHVRAEIVTGGRNNEALEQVVMRLSVEDDVANLSWSIVDAAME